MKNELKATTQKSYYGKASVIEGNDGMKYLKSYDTIVCAYDYNTGEFTRMWGGYSRTTMNHVNDFLRLFNLPTLSKKEWEAIPCGSEARFRVEVENTICRALGIENTYKPSIVFDDEEEAYTYAERLMERDGYSGRIVARVVSL